jgi:hypothetical protein
MRRVEHDDRPRAFAERDPRAVPVRADREVVGTYADEDPRDDPRT